MVIMTRTLGNVRLGIGLMLIGMLLFSLNDAMGKWLVATYSVGQVLLIRSLFALVILIPFIWKLGLPRLFGVEKPGLQALRVGFATAEVFCFYWAVQYLPLADVMTYWLAAPILVAALSPVLLREKVSLLQWLAIGAGFLGVLIALTPSGEFQFGPTMVALTGMTCFALMMITGRSLRGTPDIALVFWQNTGAGLIGGVLCMLVWVPPTGPDFFLLGVLGLVAMSAHLCVTRALKLADAAIVAPFQYTLLPYAILFGWMFFGDLPGIMTLAGGAVIIVAGLFLFVVEQRARR
jgi:drug/metabolite transporter (DMT)-like permease